MKKIKVHYADFGNMLKPKHNIFLKWLNEKHMLELTAKNPDILLFSVFGNEHLKYQNTKKIHVSGENRKTSCETYDYSICFDDNSETNLFFPNIFSLHLNKTTIKSFDIIPILSSLRHVQNTDRFCNFIYYVDWASLNTHRKTPRKNFCQQLQKYKRVDCPGKVLNNIPNFGSGRFGDWAEEKYQFIKNYKFTIAMENESAYNYVTEKIFQPLLVGSIPIYWGAPNINDFFNPKCFININDYDNFSQAIEFIKEVDNDKKLYNSFFEEPAILPSSKLNEITEERINSFFEKIIQTQKEKTC